MTRPAASPAFGDTLPSWVAQVSWLRWLRPLNGEQRLTVGLALLSAVLFVPWLGATGLWDPWEPHYGEVAREMIARGDYIHPWWESAWFFSKPALDLWLMAAGILAASANGPERHLGVFTEWGVRLPFAALTALGAILVFVAVSRLIGRRTGALAALAMLTSPLFVLFARQAVPDPVFVGLLECAMASLAIAMLDDEAHDGWCAAFYCFAGLATLSKGLLGFALPGAVALVYCVVTGEWHRLKRLRLLAGSLVVLAICAPWYGTMFAFDGRDDEAKTFFERFIVHDHFRRLASGVHTTTPGGSFTYFIEQIGFDVFPWVFAIPGAMANIARLQVRPRTPRDRALFFLLLWLLIGFSVFAFSATKFHHYTFPVLAPLLVFCALWIEDLLERGLRAQAGTVFAGGVLYALVAHDLALDPKHLTDLFVYNYDRPYPRESDPRRFLALLFYAAPAVALSPWLFDRLTQLLAGLRALPAKASRAQWAQAVRARFGGAPLETQEAPQDRLITIAAVCALAVAFAVFLGWVQWRRWSPDWSQRDLFWVYYQQSQPDEPIAAYKMNWRGETFYSRNTVRQVQRGAFPTVTLQEFLAGPGERKWLLVEQSRLNDLRTALGGGNRLRVVENRNNKFVLTLAERSQGAPPSTPQQPTPDQGHIGAPP